MAISKRVRYEVLRRDGHRCRYCGAAAPEVALTVDHVTPVALGGSDDPSNLAAACGPCNAGKTSTSPDATTVAQVDEDVIRWHRASRAASQRMASRTADRVAYCQRFSDAWQIWDEKSALLDSGWVSAVTNWHADGLPIETLVESIDIAMGSRVPGYRVWRYFYGVVKRRLAELDADARREFTESIAPEPSQWRCDCPAIDVSRVLGLTRRWTWPHQAETDCWKQFVAIDAYSKDPHHLLEAVIDGREPFMHENLRNLLWVA
jgi:hypothetical protein